MAVDTFNFALIMLFFACLFMTSNIYNPALANLSHIHNVDFFCNGYEFMKVFLYSCVLNGCDMVSFFHICVVPSFFTELC